MVLSAPPMLPTRLFSECAHELFRGAWGPQCALGHSVAPSQGCGVGAGNGTGQNLTAPCQGVGLADLFL